MLLSSRNMARAYFYGPWPIDVSKTSAILLNQQDSAFMSVLKVSDQLLMAVHLFFLHADVNLARCWSNSLMPDGVQILDASFDP